jgi:glucose/arabinose dehydrogenase
MMKRILFVLAGLLGVANPGLLSQRVINDSLALPVALPTGNYALELAWDEFNYAMALAAPPGETNELWVAERAGRIRVITDLAANTIQTSPVLDISTLRAVTTNGENGLLGLAFHPNFVVTKRLFVFYCHNLGGVRRNRVSSFEVTSEAPFIADPATEIVYLDQRDDAGNHNGGDLHFGPDGYLYVALGDEGGANDSYKNSQLVDRDFFSGLLRLDVDRRPGNIEPTAHNAIPRDAEGRAFYRVPVDNPLVAQWQLAGADPASPLRLEFYAIGLRNPWRFAFDNATGRLWLGDVGQGTREEINLVVKGGNYGWALREGFLPFTEGPGHEPPVGFSVLSDPLYDYPRSDGRSITGGVVYRGTRLPELEGAYIFGDYASGRVWALFEDPEGGAPTRQQLTTYGYHFEYGVDPSNGDISALGRRQCDSSSCAG